MIEVLYLDLMSQNLVLNRKFSHYISKTYKKRILVSLPLTSSWIYQYDLKDPREIQLTEVLKNPKEWV